jgi:2-polyprenyl-3-methyl-5-hydroxy-6-metoxy-1,4-benzoquinol methylase
MNDSKEFWLNLRTNLPKYDLRMGTATAQSYINDPKHIVFVASRYKFVAKMVAGCETVLEVGCCDAFGGPIVAQGVKRLICTDIDEELLKENVQRCDAFRNMEFRYHDFRKQPYPERVDAVYLVDVLEHIFPDEESHFMENMCASLTSSGIMIVGTPNLTAEQYASAHSRTGHVNLKDHDSLRSFCERQFHNVFLFAMNDEVLHTGYYPMAHYLWAICACRRAT